MQIKNGELSVYVDFLDLFKEIEPKMYQKSNKWHFGYIAQDVERALYKYSSQQVAREEVNSFMSKFKFLHKDESYLSLLYGEIAVLKQAENERKQRELESRLGALENGKK